MEKVLFVTGANKGIGAAIAKEALSKGYNVVAAARKTEEAKQELGEADNLLIVKADITDEDQVKQAVKEAVNRFGRIDILVNNAGYGLLGYFEEMSEDIIRKQIETNLFGTMKMTREVLPVMRKQKSGLVISITSTSGIRSVAGGSVYSASKFALEGWGEGMNIDLKPFGIRFMLVEPGPFRTDFLNSEASARFSDIKIDNYEQYSDNLQKIYMDGNHTQNGNPAKLAVILLKVVENENPPVHLVIGREAVASIDQYYIQRRNEFENWRETSVDTDFD